MTDAHDFSGSPHKDIRDGAPIKVYFFGDGRPRTAQGGHFLYPADPRERKRGVVLPWNHGFDKREGVLHLDTGLAPGGPKGERTMGVAALHHKGGWTALAFWDCTGDTRGNSNSVVIAEGTHTFNDMKTLAANHFPRVWERCLGDKLVPHTGEAA